MQILTIRKEFECKSQPFEPNSKQSNANANHWKEILTIQMQIVTIRTTFKCKFYNHSKWIQSTQMQIETIRKGFDAFKCNFERDSKYLNANSNQWKRIRSIRIQIWSFQNHSKEIQSIWIQIQTIWKGFKVFECKF